MSKEIPILPLLGDALKARLRAEADTYREAKRLACEADTHFERLVWLAEADAAYESFVLLSWRVARTAIEGGCSMSDTYAALFEATGPGGAHDNDNGLIRPTHPEGGTA
jgi:hypothetical protein